MDDLTSRLQSILSDPESMQNLAELAAMMMQPDDTDSQSAQADPPSADLPPPDMSKLLAIGQMLGQQQPDPNAALLTALKPHLSPDRAARAEKAIRLLRLCQMIGVLRESGLLSSILD